MKLDARTKAYIEKEAAAVANRKAFAAMDRPGRVVVDMSRDELIGMLSGFAERILITVTPQFIRGLNE